VCLYFPAGTYLLEHTVTAIELNGIKPDNGGMFIIKGDGPEKTIFISANKRNTILSVNHSDNIKIEGIHFSFREISVTQGYVVSINGDKLVLDIPPGFPTPADLCFERNFLVKYTDEDPMNPKMDFRKNHQTIWITAENIDGAPEGWKRNLLHLKSPEKGKYKKGDLLAVKTKCGADQLRANGKGKGFFLFNVKFSNMANRAVHIKKVDNIHLKQVTMERGTPINGRMPCLASPAGGPQIKEAKGVIIEDCKFIALGDDDLGIFSCENVIIKNNLLRDGMARSIFLANTNKNVLIEGNSFFRPNMNFVLVSQFLEKRKNNFHGDPVQNVIIRNNVFCGPGKSVTIEDCKSALIISNTFINGNPASPLIYVGESSEITISGNKIKSYSSAQWQEAGEKLEAVISISPKAEKIKGSGNTSVPPGEGRKMIEVPVPELEWKIKDE
jgi:hypothetical protein